MVYKYGYGWPGALYTGYRYAAPYLRDAAIGTALGVGAAKVRNWFKKRSTPSRFNPIGLSGYTPPEKKFCTISNRYLKLAVPSTTQDQLWPLIKVAQGTDATKQRIGNKITWSDFLFNAKVTNKTTVPAKLRVMLVRDKQWNQLTGSTSIQLDYIIKTLLEEPTHTTNWVNAPRNSNYGDRYSVLKDWKFTLEATGTPGSFVDLKFYKKFSKWWKTRFTSTIDDPVGISDGMLMLVAFSDVGISDDNPQIDFVSKFRYSDN